MDSVTFHLRQDYDDLGQRTRLLAQMAQQLMALAHDCSLAVRLCFGSYGTHLCSHRYRNCGSESYDDSHKDARLISSSMYTHILSII